MRPRREHVTWNKLSAFYGNKHTAVVIAWAGEWFVLTLVVV